MTEKFTVKKTIAESEVYDRLEKIPIIEEKLDRVIVLLEGHPGELKSKGLVDMARETNGKVKWSVKMIYALWGSLVSVAAAAVYIFIDHLGKF